MSALEDVIAAVQRAARQTPGLEDVPDYVPDQMNIDPSLFVYAGAGTWWLGGITANGLRAAWAMHTLTLRLHVYRRDSVTAQGKILPFAETVPLTLFHAYQRDKFEGTVVCLGDARNPLSVDPIPSLFAPDDVAQIETLSFLFRLAVTVEEEVAA